jgi:AcrR family transcriptional regulator
MQMGLSESRPESRMERKKEETRQKIVKAAVRLFDRLGLEAVTMEQIAEEADIAKGTLYNYFPVKGAILQEWINQTFEERHTERIARLLSLPDTRTRLIRMYSELLEGIQRQPVIFEKYLEYLMRNWASFNLNESERTGLYRLVSEVIRLGQEEGTVRRDVPNAILEDLCENLFLEVVKQYYTGRETFNAAGMIELCVDLFMSAARG